MRQDRNKHLMDNDMLMKEIDARDEMIMQMENEIQWLQNERSNLNEETHDLNMRLSKSNEDYNLLSSDLVAAEDKNRRLEDKFKSIQSECDKKMKRFFKLYWLSRRGQRVAMMALQFALQQQGIEPKPFLDEVEDKLDLSFCEQKRLIELFEQYYIHLEDDATFRQNWIAEREADAQRRLF